MPYAARCTSFQLPAGVISLLELKVKLPETENYYDVKLVFTITFHSNVARQPVSRVQTL
jgi:hypothetical protein